MSQYQQHAAQQACEQRTPEPKTIFPFQTDKRYEVRYNEDGEFGQKTGWLFSEVMSYDDGGNCRVWRPLCLSLLNQPETDEITNQRNKLKLEVQSLQAQKESALEINAIHLKTIETLVSQRDELNNLCQFNERTMDGLLAALKTAYETLERDGDEWGICEQLLAAIESVKGGEVCL